MDESPASSPPPIGALGSVIMNSAEGSHNVSEGVGVGVEVGGQHGRDDEMGIP